MSKDKKQTKAQKEAQKKVNALSEDQLRQMGKDATRLFEESQKQLVEYKMWLKDRVKSITTADGKLIDPTFMVRLLAEVDNIRIDYARLEPAFKEEKRDGKGNIIGKVPTVSIMYVFPDLIMDTFRNPPDGLVISQQVLKDFQNMVVLPERLPEHHALPQVKPLRKH